MARSFLTKLGRGIARKYAGKYIAVADNHVVASGRNRLEVYRRALRQLRVRQTLGIYYFPKPADLLSGFRICFNDRERLVQTTHLG